MRNTNLELERALIARRDRLRDLEDKHAARAEAYGALAGLADTEAELTEYLALAGDNARRALALRKQLAIVRLQLHAML